MRQFSMFSRCKSLNQSWFDFRRFDANFFLQRRFRRGKGVPFRNSAARHTLTSRFHHAPELVNSLQRRLLAWVACLPRCFCPHPSRAMDPGNLEHHGRPARHSLDRQWSRMGVGDERHRPAHRGRRLRVAVVHGAAGAEHLDFRGIQAFDANTAIVMSSGKGDLSRLYKTTDGCHSWKLMFTNPDKDGFWDAMYCARSEDGKFHRWIFGDPVQRERALSLGRCCSTATPTLTATTGWSCQRIDSFQFKDGPNRPRVLSQQQFRPPDRSDATGGTTIWRIRRVQRFAIGVPTVP